jgi:hypothetical protein
MAHSYRWIKGVHDCRRPAAVAVMLYSGLGTATRRLGARHGVVMVGGEGGADERWSLRVVRRTGGVGEDVPSSLAAKTSSGGYTKKRGCVFYKRTSNSDCD